MYVHMTCDALWEPYNNFDLLHAALTNEMIYDSSSRHTKKDTEYHPFFGYPVVEAKGGCDKEGAAHETMEMRNELSAISPRQLVEEESGLRCINCSTLVYGLQCIWNALELIQGESKQKVQKEQVDLHRIKAYSQNLK
jgi:hypothetical protein